MSGASGASLAALNTFGVEASAGTLITLRTESDIERLAAEGPLRPGFDLVLGGGSNVLFAGDLPGRVLLNRLPGRTCLDDDGGQVRICLGAGENWHDAVRWTLDQGWSGLENLALIPGRVGAAPMQNIGAYGVDLSSVLESVRAWDWITGRWRDFDRSDCRFGYRDSRFRREPDRFVITRITLRLSHCFRPHLDYAGLAEELAAMEVVKPVARDVFEAVVRIRRRKLPDPVKTGNAGSFFKNPVVGVDAAEALRREWPSLPTWPAGGDRAKLAAAWLIDQCGWKGHREGDAGVSDRHALVLVNHGKASGRDLWRLARRIQASVQAKFGIALEPEPRVIAAPERAVASQAGSG